jgi:hypothetical protein
MFTDESEINRNGKDGPRIRVRRRSGICNEPPHKDGKICSGYFTIQVWAAITYDYHSGPELVRKRDERKHNSKRDRGGINKTKHTSEALG